MSSAIKFLLGIKLESIFKIVLIKNKHIFINISIYESTVPIKHINSSSDNIGISILIMPDAAKIRWRKKNFLVKFCENGLVTRISI